MTRVQAIEEQIKSLSPGELAELRDWLLERDADDWDRQIERDQPRGSSRSCFRKVALITPPGKAPWFETLDLLPRNRQGCVNYIRGLGRVRAVGTRRSCEFHFQFTTARM
jgi:hypothetical protein